MNFKSTFTHQEIKVVAVLASIFALRMFGLCLLLPVFAIEAMGYEGATLQLVGIAAGVYGLSQALLQIPFGILSDRYGRKPMITLGLVLILLGSLVAAYSRNIYWLLCGRVLQGCGAIGGVVVATLADYTRVQVRTGAMAIMGMSIGLAFVVGLVMGPWLQSLIGMTGIFFVIGLLALSGITLLRLLPSNVGWRRDTGAGLRSWWLDLCSVLMTERLVVLNVGIFVLHASLAALFLVLPAKKLAIGVNANVVWKFYLVVLASAMVVAWLVIGMMQRVRTGNKWHNLAILGLVCAEILLYSVHDPLATGGVLCLFFAAFCILEASLPMLVSHAAPVELRGTALGVYSSLQFLGVFVGGLAGGWVQVSFGAGGVLGLCVLLGCGWLFLWLVNLGDRSWHEGLIK